MRLSDIKGEQAFKAVGQIVGCLREMFEDDDLAKIVDNENKGWILEFFQKSLESKADIWMKMYKVLNPDEEVNLAGVIKFAFDFKNDPELMGLFFSQGEQMVKNSSGSPTENTEAPETT